jgi:hypothetical protein
VKTQVVTLPRGADDQPQEASVAINPLDPDNAIVSFHQAVGEGGDHHPDVRVEARIAWTADGGQTWALADDTSHPEYRVSIDATTTFDARGNAYLVYIGMNEMSFAGRHGEYVLRSTDGGRTWGPPVGLVERGEGEQLLEHYPNLAAGDGAVYMVWDRIKSDWAVELNIVKSMDGGETWSNPRVISRHDGGIGHTTTVGADGAIYVMYVTDNEIFVTASRDRGATFDEPVHVTRSTPSSGQTWAASDFPRACGLPVVQVDPSSGRVFGVWGDHRFGDSDILCTTSDDGGRTWSEPVRVNDDQRGNGRDQVMHWFAVDPIDGSANVVFFDRRDDPENLRPRITLARSTDGGRTFANHALSDSLDPNAACLGDYIGIAACDGRVYAAWPENLGEPRPDLHVVTSGDMTLDERDWPWGPTALRVASIEFGA